MTSKGYSFELLAPEGPRDAPGGNRLSRRNAGRRTWDPRGRCCGRGLERPDDAALATLVEEVEVARVRLEPSQAHLHGQVFRDSRREVPVDRAALEVAIAGKPACSTSRASDFTEKPHR